VRRVNEQTVSGPLWCHDFDLDLPKVVSDWLDFLGYAADVELRTHCTPTNGRINCPSAWWTDHGLTAFFSTADYGAPAPPGYWTDRPLVECTFAEVVRDEWIHGQIVVVNGRLIWKPPNRLMEQLMFDVRGWTPLGDIERAAIKRHVRRSLAAAAFRLLECTA
jgi:hypothetical protein